MELAGSHSYGSQVDSVVSMLSEPDVTVAKYESMGHREVQVLECEKRADHLRIVSSRVVDVDLPGFAKRVLRPTNRMQQTDEWDRLADGSWAGTFDVVVHGAPIHISGTMTLRPEPSGTVHDVQVRVDVSVPIVGRRIADWAGNADVRRSLDGEFAFNEAWLGEHAAAPRSPRRRGAK